MTGDQACELKRTCIRESPDHFAVHARVETYGIGIVMFHLRHLRHRSFVRHHIFMIVEHELVLQFALVDQGEADCLALLNLDFIRFEQHLSVISFLHDHFDCAADLRCFPGFADSHHTVVMPA